MGGSQEPPRSGFLARIDSSPYFDLGSLVVIFAHGILAWDEVNHAVKEDESRKSLCQNEKVKSHRTSTFVQA